MPFAEACLRALPAFAAVWILGHLLGVILRRFGQPPVIGAVLAGILLGPSLLGAETAALLLPAESAAPLKAVALLGVMLYMFQVGLDLDAGLVRRHLRTTLAVSLSGIFVPFVLGALLSLPLFAAYAGPSATPAVFALFMGIALSITAFPVLVRILDDLGLTQQPLGQSAIRCAALADLSIWSLLGLMMLCAGMSQGPGLHASLGAFFLGALLPRRYLPADSLVAIHRVLQPASLLLLPAFFAYAGMQTRLDWVAGWTDWGVSLLIIFCAAAGKIGGTWIAARACGESRRDATALGILMNTRGLMELIVLQIGLELGLLGAPLFSMLTLMAVVTTLATTPLLRRLLRSKV